MGLSRAGTLPRDETLQGTVMFQSGERCKDPRKGISKKVTFNMAEGFEVVKAKLFRLLSGSEFGPNPSVIEEENVFFKATKNSRQQDFKPHSETNFMALLTKRWGCITEDDIATLASNEEPIHAQFGFEFFVCLAPAVKPTDGIRRATADRVRAAAAEIAAVQAEGRDRLGPIAAHHLAVHRARQPDGTPFSIPEDNTMLQARALDEAATALEDRATQPEDEVVHVEVELFNTWVKLRVKRSSLRAALGLPQHDIFSRGIFHGFRTDEMIPEGDNVPDTDHSMPQI